MTEVVAALIWHGDRFLICQRPAHKQRGLLWEFVGGKVEPEETRQEALIRECQEELDITLDVGDIFYEVDHVYPDITIHLTLFNAAIARGTPKLLEHNDLRWITVEEMGDYAFCPADTEILAQIRARCPAGGADHG
jgi:8-oxo-dGTP diphosphatase